MLKKIILGFVYAILLYFIACATTGALAGAKAGANDPENAAQVGAEAGAKAVLAIRGYLILAAIMTSLVGTTMGVLPGTKTKIKTENNS